MYLQALKEQYKKELKELYPPEEVQTFFNWLCEAYLGLKPYQVMQRLDMKLDENEQRQFLLALEGLKQERPIQHIIGQAHFYGLDFKVNQHTLIPRPETEELVDWMVSDHANDGKKLRILDIGTGSGCIPIALAKNLPKGQLFSVDVSTEALELAQQNALDNGVVVKFGQINILKVSLLASIFTETDQFDIIVSNPPYVRELEKAEIKKNVLQYEPASALFVSDDDPLVFYKKITELAVGHLKKGGVLYFEINQYLGRETLSMLKSYGFAHVELRKDLFGKDRMVKAIV